MDISVPLVRLLADNVVRMGVDRAEWLAHAGVDPALLEDPRARVGVAEYDRLQELALAMTGDPALGLHMGEQASVGVLNVVGYLFMNCRTIEEAFTVFNRYHRIISDCRESRMEKDADTATIFYEFPRGSTACNRLRAEFGLVLLVRIGHLLVGHPVAPLQVRFEHPTPAYAAEYARVFGCEAVFDCTETSVVLPRALLEAEQAHASRELFGVLQAQADRMLAQLESRGFADRVRELILGQYGGIRPDAATVAARFHISVRTLNRRLRAEGTGYREVADAAAFEKARQRLADPGAGIQEIAYELGFSEPSAFHRAFRRWAGVSPQKYRLGLLVAH